MKIKSAFLKLFHAEEKAEGHRDSNRRSSVMIMDSGLYVGYTYDCRFKLCSQIVCGHTESMDHQMYGNVTMDNEEIQCGGVDSIHVAQDREEWLAL